MEARVIVLEFNELTPRLITALMREGKLPGFSRLFREAQVWTTDAEETGWNLEPWIQWVTVHTGMGAADHQVHRLDDAPTCKALRLWDMVSRAGAGPNWICGSMNGVAQEGFDGYLLPDPWSSAGGPLPAGKFEPYYRFVRAHVQEYTNDKVPLSPLDNLRFLAWMATNGLSVEALGMVVRQLAQERYRKVHWRRAAVLDRLQWDVFSHHYKRLKPRLATFFLNSTAHYQHVYWRNMEPERFRRQPSAEDQALHEKAIEYGYRRMDRLVSKCLDLAGDEVTVVLASALSQQPCLKYEDRGGKVFHRPRRMEALLRYAGIEGVTAVPVMSEEFHLQARDAAHAAEVARRLEGLHVGGQRAMSSDLHGSRVSTGCILCHAQPSDAVLEGGAGPKPFFELFYQADTLKSGMHHPDGLLWIRRPDKRHEVHPGRVPLRAVAPTLLDLLGIERPVPMLPSLFEPRPVEEEPLRRVASGF